MKTSEMKIQKISSITLIDRKKLHHHKNVQYRECEVQQANYLTRKKEDSIHI